MHTYAEQTEFRVSSISSISSLASLPRVGHYFRVSLKMNGAKFTELSSTTFRSLPSKASRPSAVPHTPLLNPEPSIRVLCAQDGLSDALQALADSCPLPAARTHAVQLLEALPTRRDAVAALAAALRAPDAPAALAGLLQGAGPARLLYYLQVHPSRQSSSRSA